MNVTVNGKVVIDGAEYEFDLRLRQTSVPLKPAAQPKGEPTSNPRLLKVPEVAQILGIARSHVYAMLQAGKIPGKVTFGSSIRVSADVLSQWIRDKAAQ